MKKPVFFTVILSAVLLFGTVVSHAAEWIKNNADIPNKNMEANYYDSQSVKVRKKTLSWTEKTVLTSFGTQYYSKHLSQYATCKKSISEKGEATYHQIDFEIKEGKYRTVAKRNYSKDDKLLCTDKDMGTELDKSWHVVQYQSPMYYREYELVTKYKLGNVGAEIK